jgi:hypothetical protein
MHPCHKPIHPVHPPAQTAAVFGILLRCLQAGLLLTPYMSLSRVFLLHGHLISSCHSNAVLRSERIFRRLVACRVSICVVLPTSAPATRHMHPSATLLRRRVTPSEALDGDRPYVKDDQAATASGCRAMLWANYLPTHPSLSPAALFAQTLLGAWCSYSQRLVRLRPRIHTRCAMHRARVVHTSSSPRLRGSWYAGDALGGQGVRQTQGRGRLQALLASGCAHAPHRSGVLAALKHSRASEHTGASRCAITLMHTGDSCASSEHRRSIAATKRVSRRHRPADPGPLPELLHRSPL